VVKLFGMLSLVAGLAVGGVFWSQQAKTAQQEGRASILGAATTALELNHRAGVTFSEVKVVRADATSYCVEAAGYVLTGPGGKPQRGRCS